MQKLYCYVDESGQYSTAHFGRRRVFVVAVAVFEEDREMLEKACERYERESGEGKRKWSHCNSESRLTYLQLVFADQRFYNSLCFSHSEPPLKPEFDTRTILSIAKAIWWRKPEGDYTSEIYIDGISKSKQSEYARELRKIGIRVKRVHKARDESYALIRLADSLAGLARAALENQEGEEASLLGQAMRRGASLSCKKTAH
ncbi:MAG: DUF3800 domain-containing protein [Anaerolineae bacterium]|nr:DUF3800 domain-containing protein [Candidatus Roseilinea sp.]MDW8449608.1 DUF3800 domain-containing protein [Anaerolineae bacterium]